MYEQKMCYIDLYRDGVKCGNMGHVRMEWDEDRYRFGASLCHMDRQTLVTAVLERAGGRPRTTIQNIAIIHGKGNAQFDWMPIEGDEESLLFQASGQVYGVCCLPKMREISEAVKTNAGEAVQKNIISGEAEAAEQGAMPEAVEAAETQQTEQEHMKQETAQRAEQEHMKQETAQQAELERVKQETAQQAEQEHMKQETALRAEQENMKQETAQQAELERAEQEALQNKTGRAGVRREASQNHIAEYSEDSGTKTDKQDEAYRTSAATYPQSSVGRRKGEQHVTTLSDDKWKQLCSIYPNVHPIKEDVDFVEITPADFVILRQEYQNLVRNSFLLHGYYNYNHVLLGKYPDKYYIGVPGIMHEQERIAAAMFGFVGFERAEAPKEQKENREQFGYYMMEVGI